MMNLQPPAVYAPPSITASPSPIGGGGAAVTLEGNGRSITSAEQLVLDLCDPELRKNALNELAKMFQDVLGPLLWHSFGTIAALLQRVASHPETRMLFLEANIPLFLYPFLNTKSKTRPSEHLRLTSLGVIGALVKVNDTKVINFLLKNEIVPLCLHCMDMGTELSKTVATFIVQKILLDDLGLCYMCAPTERLFAVGRCLASMVVSHSPARLLKLIIRCFFRLSDNPRACAALQTLLPDVLKDGTVDHCIVDDPATRHCLQQLLHNVTVTVEAVGGAPQPCLEHMTRI